jgi:flagellar protein FliO/FliZ
MSTTIAIRWYLFACFFFLSPLYGQESHPAQQMPESHVERVEMPRNQPSEINPNNHYDPASDPFLNEPQTEAGDFQSKFLNMLVMLGLLIGLMIGASWFLKRMMNTRQNQLNTDSYITVLETRQLSPRSTIYVLEVKGQGIVIGESATGIHLLTKFHLDADQETNEPQNPFPQQIT